MTCYMLAVDSVPEKYAGQKVHGHKTPHSPITNTGKMQHAAVVYVVASFPSKKISH